MSPAARPEEPTDFDPERRRGLAMALAAYNKWLDGVATETRYYLLGEREDIDEQEYLGDIIQRAAARQRERERAAPS